MKLASYELRGRRSYGLVEPNGVVDLGSEAGAAPTLLEALPAIAAGKFAKSALVAADEVRWLAPIWNSDRIICVGLNYRSHVKELGREPPLHPMLFVRFADSLVAHGEHMVRPRASERFDFEAELAVIIGKEGRHISTEHALEHVFGYACFNDGTLRDFQSHSSQFLPGKTFWRSGAFGPHIVTAEEVGEIGGLEIKALLNGEEMQRANLHDLLFSVPELIAYISTFMPLRVGDIIATGTTGGVGAARTPQVWMKPGDTIEVVIDKIGLLRNTIIDEGA